ncbi:MAG: dethiobiotin synthase, partial [Dehalococcoidia bacterium]|nr:dethiobiotin synthase [Dehalococcoidia bacterium]
MSNRVVFVTGTDTGVGKTVVAAWLAAALAPRRRVALVKPFQTGATDPVADGDEAFYRAALGDEEVEIRTLVSLPEPLAPSIAAERAGTPIDVAAALMECRALARESDITLVEGAGGLLVSITAEHDMAGFAAALDASLVVVVRPSLGTLNHTSLTLEAAERRGLPVEMIVVSGFPADAGVTEWENLRWLRDRFPALPLVVLAEAPLSPSDPLAGGGRASVLAGRGRRPAVGGGGRGRGGRAAV